jgi:hypothetical protein
VTLRQGANDLGAAAREDGLLTSACGLFDHQLPGVSVGSVEHPVRHPDPPFLVSTSARSRSARDPIWAGRGFGCKQRRLGSPLVNGHSFSSGPRPLAVVRPKPMNFIETEEQTLLRQEVRAIAKPFGREYYLKKARAGEPLDELWAAVGAAGYLGVNIPESHGGGGLGISELAMVSEELAAAGCPLLLLLVSPAICGTILARFGTPAQQDTWLPGLATGKQKLVFAITEPDAGSNSHRISTVARREGRRVGAERHQVLHLGRGRGRRHPGGRVHARRGGAAGAVALLGGRERTRPDQDAHPHGAGRGRASVHAVLRRRAGTPASGSSASRGTGCSRCSWASTPSASWAPPWATASRAMRSRRRRALRERAGGVRGAHRHAPGHRAPLGAGQDRGGAGARS